MEVIKNIRIERCPNPKCHSEDIEYDAYDGEIDDGYYMEQPCKCNKCGLDFTIIREYKLTKLTVAYDDTDIEDINWRKKNGTEECND